MVTTSSAWIPPAGITTHAGKPISSDLEFFAAPPIEIGKITSAYSTLTVSTQPLSTAQRLFRALLWGIGFTVVTALLVTAFHIPLPWNVLTGLVVGAIAAALIYTYILVFYQTCSYVGEQGIAEYSINGSRSAEPESSIMRFQDAANLYTSQTRRYKNGAYQGTDFRYTWQMPGRKPFEIWGTHHAQQGLPDDTSNWHFANAAEAAWSNHLLRVINEQLQRLGYVEFPMQQANPQAVRVGQGFLEFVLKDGSTQTVAVTDMKDIKLQSGSFYFAHKDARWWSGKGKYEFMYSNLPNAQLFLLCLNQLAGIRWS
ncbi:hypothetical protein H6G89_13100 [Oscillatoria sp. FACHB-1407]|uniref:hypothetical protein n=1 Tax=Oscillatoria sp. FACHB-1407 TaxID=2692847 RepID=UPI001685BD91|nr:hypothetical protein [Oscillatoria sp. FACHB-1407]MBD2461985.1 hypothetical protein [Oscillatoria sp. FACHB-1407]